MISGYIHRHYSHYIPTDVIKLCQLFFSELYLASLDMNKIKKLKYNESSYIEQELNIKGLKFKCFLIREHSYYDAGIYWLALECTNYTFDELLQCDMYYEIVIDELKKSNISNLKFGSCFSRSNRILLISISGAQIDKIGPSLEKLSFTLYFDILYLKHKHQTKLSYEKIFEKVKLSKKIHYEWKIDDELMENFKNAENDESFYSDNFGFNAYNNDPLKQYGFCLTFIQKSGYKIGKGKLYLKNIGLPKDVISFAFELELKCGDRTRLIRNLRSINRFIPLNDIEIPSEALKIEVSIVITKVQDIAGNKIEEHEWHKYGIE